MPKKIIQDIVINKNNRPAVLRPKPTKPKSAIPESPKAELVKSEPPRRPKEFAVEPRRGKKTGAKFIFWVLFTVFFVFIIGFVVSFLSSVSIKITPKQAFILIDTDFNARRSAEGGVLPFEIMRIERTEKYKAKSSGFEKISEKASGRIAIYNAYKSKPQLLVANTRFESPDGKIYRIKKNITVPGAEIKDGEIAPSSIEATVYADEPGEKYNIGLVDFKIPGFKGGPRYEKFYARSKTEMTGGFEGVVSVVANEDIAKAESDLENRIKKYLKEEVYRQKPEQFLLYEDALVFNLLKPENNPKAAERKKNFEYELNGEAIGFLIKKTDLAEELAKRYLKDKFSGVDVVNMDELEFTLLERGEEDKNITFNLKGKAHFVWRVDTASLLDKIINAKKEEYNSIFMSYPSVDEAEILFRPSWWRMIPNNENRIHFEQVLKSE